MAYMREWLILLLQIYDLRKNFQNKREEKCVLRNKTSDFAHCTLGGQIILRVILKKLRSILIENAPGNEMVCL